MTKAKKAAAILALGIAWAGILPLAGESPSPFSISLTLINDNTPFIHVTEDGGLGLKFGKGPDNAFTMGLRMDASLEAKLLGFDGFRLSSFLNSYTHMDRTRLEDGGWRVDFLSFMLWAEKGLGPLGLGIGLGAAGRGNFGGAFLQNSAHRLFGDEGYALEYLPDGEALAGPLAGLEASFGLTPLPVAGFVISPSGGAIALADLFGVASSSLSLFGALSLETGNIEIDLEAGYRWTRAGGADWLAELFSSRFFLSSSLGCKLGKARLVTAFSLNPFGNSPSPEESFRLVQNQQYSWSIGFGEREPPRGSRLFQP